MLANILQEPGYLVPPFIVQMCRSPNQRGDSLEKGIY